MENEFVVLYTGDGFYIRQVELEDLKNINFPISWEIENICIHGMDYHDDSEVAIHNNNLNFSTLESLIEAVNDEIHPKYILNLDILFCNGNEFHFNTEELSLTIKDQKELDFFVTQLLKLYQFEAHSFYEKLKSLETKYYIVSPENNSILIEENNSFNGQFWGEAPPF